MLRSLALVDGRLGDARVGTFIYDNDTRQFSMTISRDIPPNDLPLSLEGFVFRGKYELPHEDTLRWIRRRLCPPGRHNIREILRVNGLEGYDEFGFLMVTKAKCDNDELYLVEEI